MKTQTLSLISEPIGKPFASKIVDMQNGEVTEVTEVTAEPATEEEIEHTF